MANNPTASAHHRQATHTAVKVPEEEEEDSFDWASYLREGDEKFVCVYDDSSSVSLNIVIFTCVWKLVCIKYISKTWVWG